MACAIDANCDYSGKLFKFFFGNYWHREWTLSLYNALNGSHYTNAEEIYLKTIDNDNGVYISMKNDVSFLLDFYVKDQLQHDFAFSNMPIRFLKYAGLLCFREYFARYYSSFQKFRTTQKFICFYKGSAFEKDKITLSLSDSFDGESDIDVKVTMLNVNSHYNWDLLDGCLPLKELVSFVDIFRSNQQTAKTLDEAVDASLESLSDDWFIKPYLVEDKINMVFRLAEPTVTRENVLFNDPPF